MNNKYNIYYCLFSFVVSFWTDQAQGTFKENLS